MKTAILSAVAVLVVLPIVAILCVVPVWLLWNWLMPEIFGLKAITIWQAAGLFVLSNLLLKSTTSTSSKS